jgi:hypothetical protein
MNVSAQQTGRARNEGACYVPVPIDASKGPANLEADIPFAPYDLSKPYDSHKGKSEVAYYYATSKGCGEQKPITKPIIIIDGFDPNDIRDAGNIYGERLLYNDNLNLGQDLRSLGYDVIILNFPKHEVARVSLQAYNAIPHKFMLPKDTLSKAVLAATGLIPPYLLPIYQDHGGDYLERNAFVLVKLIQQTNDSLQKYNSSEKLVVVGASAGGLVARIALAYMEQNNLNHNTRLYVSFDSPHNRANIPIGAQKFLEHLARVENNYDAEVSITNRLGAVAAKQLLLSHRLGWEPNLQVVPFHFVYPFYKSAPIFRSNLVNTLQNIGFPNNLRKVALVNGAINGLKYDGNTNPEDEALYLEVDKRTGHGNSHIWQGKPLQRGNVYFGQGYGNMSKIARYTKRRNDGLGILYGVWEETNYSYTSATGSTAYDIVSGGTYNLFKEIADEANADPNGWEWPVSYSANFSIRKEGHCFIPTKSALAFKGTNQDLGEALNNRNLVCTNETPFDAYYAPSTNEGHTDLTQESVAWVLE